MQPQWCTHPVTRSDWCWYSTLNDRRITVQSFIALLCRRGREGSPSFNMRCSALPWLPELSKGSHGHSIATTRYVSTSNPPSGQKPRTDRGTQRTTPSLPCNRSKKLSSNPCTTYPSTHMQHNEFSSKNKYS